MRVNDAWNLIPQVWMALVRSNCQRIIHQLRVTFDGHWLNMNIIMTQVVVLGDNHWSSDPMRHIFITGTLRGGATTWTYRQASLSISSELLLKFVPDGNM